jgi:hypothetical protein
MINERIGAFGLMRIGKEIEVLEENCPTPLLPPKITYELT